MGSINLNLCSFPFPCRILNVFRSFRIHSIHSCSPSCKKQRVFCEADFCARIRIIPSSYLPNCNVLLIVFPFILNCVIHSFVSFLCCDLDGQNSTAVPSQHRKQHRHHHNRNQVWIGKFVCSIFDSFFIMVFLPAVITSKTHS